MTKVAAESSSLSDAITAAVIALMAIGGAGWMGWMLGWPLILDINDPDFNPLIFMLGLLIGVTLWHLVKAARALSRHRRFGVASLVLDGQDCLRLGRPLSGMIRLDRPVVPTGPFKLVLTCHDVHDTGDAGSPRREVFPVWTAQTELPPGTDVQKGLRFRFELPTSVGPEPVPSGIVPDNKYFRFRMTVNIPGMRQVIQQNHPPVDRYWTLVASAPTPGADFRAEVVVPLDSLPRKGRLP